MKKLKVLMLTILILISGSYADNILGYYKCIVDRVVDGDTVYANCEANNIVEYKKIRIVSVDTFEVKRYKRAYKQAEITGLTIDEVVAQGKKVSSIVANIFEVHNNKFVCVYFGKGVYQRDLCAIVFNDGLDLSVYLKCNGLALPYMVRDIHKPYFKSCDILNK